MAYTTIDLPTDYFNTKLYTGTGSNNITLDMDNIGFLWIKRREASGGHVIFDSVRGGHYTGSGAKPVLITNVTSAAQGTDIDSTTKGIDFGSTSTVIGSDSQGYNYNTSTGSYVAWHWQAGGSASSNTDGSITSSVSVSTTAGFSIVSYTGTGSAATVGHGLGVVPKIVLAKRRSQASNWCMYNVNVGNTKALYFNNDTVGATSTTFWNDTTPTSSVFTVGSDAATNGSSDTQIAYCFAEKQGYSKFGKYTGNGNADGTFVYTGFKPAFVITKRITDGNESWHLFDNKRNTFNDVDTRIQANSNGGEDTAAPLGDFVSNGFKIRGTGGGINVSGKEFIYMAFAESPFVSSGGIPTTAR